MVSEKARREIESQIKTLELEIKQNQSIQVQLQDQLKAIDKALDKVIPKRDLELKSHKDRNQMIVNYLLNARDQNRNLAKNINSHINNKKRRIRDSLKPKLR